VKKIVIFLIGLLFSLQIAQAENSTIKIVKGWNALSFRGIQTLESLKTKIGANNLLVIQGEGDVSYKKAFVDDKREFLNTFTQTETGKGYWIKVDNNKSFNYQAEEYTETKSINLRDGWNFIGAIKELNITDIKAQLGADNLLVVQGAGQGKTYKKSFVDNGTPELNSFTKFELDQGYWVKLVSPATLSFEFDTPQPPKPIIDKEARDNTNRLVQENVTIDGKEYKVKVYTSQIATEEVSKSNITIYGNINGQRVKFYINDNYPSDTKFQVRVFDTDGKEVKSSAILDYNNLAIEFGDINITTAPTLSNNYYKITLKSTNKIAGYEIHLKFTDDIGSNITLNNDFLKTTGRNVSDLGPNIDNSKKLIAFGAFSFGNQDGVSGDFEPLIFDSNDSKNEISIVKKSCIDVDAKEVDCEVSILDR